MQNENQQENTKPHVSIFGEDIKKRETKHETEEVYHHVCKGKRCHRHRHSGIFGLVVLFVGIGLLLSNFGLISPAFWVFVTPFWPIILILIGVKMLLGRNWFSSIVVFFIALLVLGSIFVYGLIKVNSPTVNYLPQEVPDFINNNFKN